MTPSSPLRGRGWPLVILAGVFILLLFMVALPVWQAFAGQEDEAEQARQALVVYRAQTAARPRLENKLAALDQQEVGTAALLRGTSTALAAASVQSLVKALVERHGGQMRSAQTLTASLSNGLEKVEVQVELSIPPGGLKSAIYELETGTPYLFLDDVGVRPEAYAGGATGAPGALHVNWTLHGYRKAGTP